MGEVPSRLAAALSDRYRIERELGAGGMATVYLAEDPKHKRKVALKVLKPELGAVLGAERFVNEIRTTANLQHPNLLPLFDSGEADGFLYYVMPYVEGETLRARLEREQQLPVDETVRLVSLLAGALDFAHARNVVHRDLKPENILLQAGQPAGTLERELALLNARLGLDDLEGAMTDLESVVLNDPQRVAAYGMASKAYDPLRADPRFAAVLRQLNLDVARLTLPDGGRSQ